MEILIQKSQERHICHFKLLVCTFGMGLPSGLSNLCMYFNKFHLCFFSVWNSWVKSPYFTLQFPSVKLSFLSYDCTQFPHVFCICFSWSIFRVFTCELACWTFSWHSDKQKKQQFFWKYFSENFSHFRPFLLEKNHQKCLEMLIWSTLN